MAYDSDYRNIIQTAVAPLTTLSDLLAQRNAEDRQKTFIKDEDARKYAEAEKARQEGYAAAMEREKFSSDAMDARQQAGFDAQANLSKQLEEQREGFLTKQNEATERKDLQTRAKAYGVSYSKNTSNEELQDKIFAAAKTSALGIKKQISDIQSQIAQASQPAPIDQSDIRLRALRNVFNDTALMSGIPASERKALEADAFSPDPNTFANKLRDMQTTWFGKDKTRAANIINALQTQMQALTDEAKQRSLLSAQANVMALKDQLVPLQAEFAKHHAAMAVPDQIQILSSPMGNAVNKGPGTPAAFTPPPAPAAGTAPPTPQTPPPTDQAPNTVFGIDLNKLQSDADIDTHQKNINLLQKQVGDLTAQGEKIAQTIKTGGASSIPLPFGAPPTFSKFSPQEMLALGNKAKAIDDQRTKTQAALDAAIQARDSVKSRAANGPLSSTLQSVLDASGIAQQHLNDMYALAKSKGVSDQQIQEFMQRANAGDKDALAMLAQLHDYTQNQAAGNALQQSNTPSVQLPDASAQNPFAPAAQQ